MSESNPFDLGGAEEKSKPEKAPAAVEKKSEEPKEAAPKKARKPRQTKPKVTGVDAVKAVTSDKFPLSAISGQIIGSITQNLSAVPVVKLQLRGYVGVPPLEFVAEGIEDVRKVLDELVAQAEKAVAGK